MKKILIYLILFNIYFLNSQTINLNESHIIDYLRASQQVGILKSDFSFNIRPIHIGKNGLKINDSVFNSNKFNPELVTFLKGNGSIKILTSSI